MPACLRSESGFGWRALLMAWALGALLALACWPRAAQAHASSLAYLQVSGDRSSTLLQADVSLRDLDAALDLDLDGDARLTWGELRLAEPRVQAWLAQGIALRDCPAPWQAGPLALEQRGDGLYARLRLSAPCPLPPGPPLHYRLLAEVDATHRALLRIERAGQATQATLLSPETASAATEAPMAFWREGVHHLITGHDHLLFLLCLLLPALPRRLAGPPQAGELGRTLRPIVGWVTAFTLAHSLTLGLAVLGGLRLPATLIEPLIAASIVLAAVDNLRPFLHRLLGLPRWGVALLFGLVHGFGFAGALGELNLPPAAMAWALLQFNLGLEVAQLSLVALAVAALWRLRAWPGYGRWVQGLGSSLAAVAGTVWLWQRLA